MKLYLLPMALFLISCSTIDSSRNEQSGIDVINFQDALIRAKVTENSQPKNFNWKVNAFYAATLGEIKKTCKVSHPEAVVKNIEFVALVSKNGEFIKFWNANNNLLSNCYINEFSKNKFPLPPMSPYHTHLEYSM